MNVAVQGNFDVQSRNIVNPFPNIGWWYEYFTGDSINVTNALAPISLTAGEYRIYTDVKLAQPEITEAPASIEELLISSFELKVYPNPAAQLTTLRFASQSIEPYTVLLINEAGQVVMERKGTSASGNNEIPLNVTELPAGSYHFLVKVGKAMANEGFVKVD